MMGAACFVPNITPRTLVSNTEEKWSAETSVILTMGEPLPAVVDEAIQRRRTGSWTACCTIALTLASSVDIVPR